MHPCLRADTDVSEVMMIWFFTRGAAQIDIEVRRGRAPGAYTLAVTYPDGAERIEQLASAARLVTRALTIQQRLIDEGWMPTGPASGRPAIARRARRRHVRSAATAARRVLTTVRLSLSKRLAATFGL
jgi:hypothetical protein